MEFESGFYKKFVKHFKKNFFHHECIPSILRAALTKNL